jgi:hypothetical protein
MEIQSEFRKGQTHNSSYPKGGVWCSKDNFVVNQTLVFQIEFCGKSPALRVAAKRCPRLASFARQSWTTEGVLHTLLYDGRLAAFTNHRTTRCLRYWFFPFVRYAHKEKTNSVNIPSFSGNAKATSNK